MIDLYYWTTPNGHKITVFLEETGTEYRVVPINISAGEQFGSSFLKISPNNRIPAIVDHAPGRGMAPLGVFESGAILLYLAEKTGQLISANPVERAETLQWLFWQVGGLGPMAGQTNHFSHYAPERIPYAIERYVNETGRLFAVLDKRLAGREYIAGYYSIADIACYPWVVPYERLGQSLSDVPNVRRWFESIRERPAVQRAYAMATRINTQPVVTEEARKHLFGQSGETVRRMPQ